MKPGSFSYHVPSSLSECLDLLDEYGDDAALLAGGQSLVPLLRFRLAQPAHILSIREISEQLQDIRIDGGYLVIGARVTYAQVQQSRLALQACPGLRKAIELIATPAVRNRGTVCGNLCQADPASELPALALLLDARMRLESLAGARVVPARDFFLGPYSTARAPNEMLVSAEFPVRPPQECVAIQEVTRLRGGFPMAGVAVALSRGEGRALRSAAVACFGVHALQLRVDAAEAQLLASGYSAEAMEAAAQAIDDAIEPHGDVFSSTQYRRSAVRSLFHRAMTEAWKGTGGSE